MMIIQHTYAEMIVDLMVNRAVYLTMEDRAAMLQMITAHIQGLEIPHWPGRFASFDPEGDDMHIVKIPDWINFTIRMWGLRSEEFQIDVGGDIIKSGDILKWNFTYESGGGFMPTMLGVPTTVVMYLSTTSPSKISSVCINCGYIKFLGI